MLMLLPLLPYEIGILAAVLVYDLLERRSIRSKEGKWPK